MNYKPEHSGINHYFEILLNKYKYDYIDEYCYKNTHIKSLIPNNEVFSKSIKNVYRYFDFYLPELNLLIEINPIFTHCLEKHDKEKELKREIAKQDNKNVLFIFYQISKDKILKSDEINLKTISNKKEFYERLELLVKNNFNTEFLKNISNEFEYVEDIELVKEQYNSKYNKDKVSIEEAKELWPKWYQRRIVEGKPRKYFQYSRNLYDWWHNKLIKGNEIKPGFRYFCTLSLVSFATKCGVPFEEVQKDLYELVPTLDEKTIDEDNHFLKEDVDDALKLYGTEKAYKFRRETISNMTNVEIKANKRNGRSREQHLAFAREMKRVKEKIDGKKPRKTKDNKRVINNIAHSLIKYQSHPISHKKLAEELEINIKTLRKWLPKAEEEAKKIDDNFSFGSQRKVNYYYEKEIREFIINNYPDKWTKKELANYLNISTDKLRKILREKVDVSFFEKEADFFYNIVENKGESKDEL